MAKKTNNNKSLTTEEEKFCRHYADYGNGRQAFMYAWPNSNFNSSSELASRLLKKVEIDNRIQQHREEVAVQFNQTLDGNIRELVIAAEEAKKAFQFSAYASLRKMIIELCGIKPPDKLDITTNGKDINTINVHIIESPQSDDNDGA